MLTIKEFAKSVPNPFTCQLKHIHLKLTKVATQLRCSCPFGNVL